MFASLGTGAGLSAIWTITAIAYERCQAISAPLNSARAFTSKKVKFNQYLHCITLNGRATLPSSSMQYSFFFKLFNSIQFNYLFSLILSKTYSSHFK